MPPNQPYGSRPSSTTHPPEPAFGSPTGSPSPSTAATGGGGGGSGWAYGDTRHGEAGVGVDSRASDVAAVGASRREEGGEEVFELARTLTETRKELEDARKAEAELR